MCFFDQIFLHFGQFYCYSRQVCDKRLAKRTAITDTLTLNGSTRNAKHVELVKSGLELLQWSYNLF